MSFYIGCFFYKKDSFFPSILLEFWKDKLMIGHQTQKQKKQKNLLVAYVGVYIFVSNDAK